MDDWSIIACIMKCVGFHAIYVMDDVEMNENRGKLMKAGF